MCQACSHLGGRQPERSYCRASAIFCTFTRIKPAFDIKSIMEASY